MRVLVMEDEAGIARDILCALAHAGFAAEHAPDGATAWERGGTEPFDAVIPDLSLPAPARSTSAGGIFWRRALENCARLIRTPSRVSVPARMKSPRHGRTVSSRTPEASAIRALVQSASTVRAVR